MLHQTPQYKHCDRRLSGRLARVPWYQVSCWGSCLAEPVAAHSVLCRAQSLLEKWISLHHSHWSISRVYWWLNNLTLENSGYTNTSTKNTLHCSNYRNTTHVGGLDSMTFCANSIIVGKFCLCNFNYKCNRHYNSTNYLGSTTCWDTRSKAFRPVRLFLFQVSIIVLTSGLHWWCQVWLQTAQLAWRIHSQPLDIAVQSDGDKMEWTCWRPYNTVGSSWVNL